MLGYTAKPYENQAGVVIIPMITADLGSKMADVVLTGEPSGEEK
jgi:hypothetical protein